MRGAEEQLLKALEASGELARRDEFGLLPLVGCGEPLGLAGRRRLGAKSVALKRACRELRGKEKS